MMASPIYVSVPVYNNTGGSKFILSLDATMHKSTTIIQLWKGSTLDESRHSLEEKAPGPRATRSEVPENCAENAKQENRPEDRVVLAQV